MKNVRDFNEDFKSMTDDEFREFMRNHLAFSRESMDVVIKAYAGKENDICRDVKNALEWAEANVETADRRTLEAMRRLLHLEYLEMANSANDIIARNIAVSKTLDDAAPVDYLLEKMTDMLPHDAALYCADMTIKFADADRTAGIVSEYDDDDIERLRILTAALRDAIALGGPFAEEQADLEDHLNDMTMKCIAKFPGIDDGLGLGGGGRKPGSGGFLN